MSGREKSAWVHNFLADAPRDFTQGSKIQEKEVWRFEITKKLSFPYSRCLKITKKSHSTVRAKRATFTF